MPDIPDSQGTTFTYNSVEFTAKQVKVKRSNATVDVTPLSQAAGTMRLLQSAPLKDGDEISCEYWGTTAPVVGQKQAIACSKLGISGNAFCEEFELTAQVGELIVGNATFKLTFSAS